MDGTVQERGDLARMFLTEAQQYRDRAFLLLSKADESDAQAQRIIEGLEGQANTELKVKALNAKALYDLERALDNGRKLCPHKFAPSFRVVKGGAA